MGSNTNARKGSDFYRFEGILFDRVWKIPEHKGNKLSPNWKPDDVKMLEGSFSNEELIKNVMQSRKASASNPLA